MRENFKISIITPVYNGEKYIEETIISVINQTYKNWELIIIDDCSVDKTKDIVSDFAEKDSRIIYKCLDKNSGASEARNEGIKLAKGRYISFLDSDDLWKETKLEKQIKYMEENDIAISFTAYDFINENSEEIGKVVKVPNIVGYKDLLKYNCIGCLTVMINIDKVGKFKFPNIKHEDYITWLGILKRGIFAYGINENLASYRKRKGSLSENKIQTAKWHWNILRKEEKIHLFKAFFYFINYAMINIRKHIL